MIYELKSSEGFANSYVICRFHECVIINPSHSYEEIILYIGSKTIVGLFATEVSKNTIDQIAYYNAPLYLSAEQDEVFNEQTIDGYKTIKEYPFDINKIEKHKYSDIDRFRVGELYLKPHIINGVLKPTTVFEISDNLFVGSLFDKNKLAKKANYKSSIYDLKKSTLRLIELPNNYNIYHSFREKSKLSSEKINNPEVNRWI